MIKGLNKQEEELINSIIEPYKKEYEFFYYGSRVKGNFEKTSDLDILIKGEKSIPYSSLETIKFMFDKSNLPFIVNFSDYNNIDENFYNMIKKDLVKI